MAVKILRYVPLPELSDLTLSFPITNEYGHFFSNPSSVPGIPISGVAQQLRHLNVRVSDNTGRGGQRYRYIKLSAAKSHCPNATHALQLFRFIELATELDTLCMQSTDSLSLDNLNFRQNTHLHALSLSGIAISHTKLLSLLEQCKATIKRVEFREVELNSGKWQNVLVGLIRLPLLRYFYIDSSGYSLAGESSRFRPLMFPEIDDPESIETLNNQDYPALGYLQRQINANRRGAGLRETSDHFYRFAEMPINVSLESLEIAD